MLRGRGKRTLNNIVGVATNTTIATKCEHPNGNNNLLFEFAKNATDMAKLKFPALLLPFHILLRLHLLFVVPDLPTKSNTELTTKSMLS